MKTDWFGNEKEGKQRKFVQINTFERRKSMLHEQPKQRLTNDRQRFARQSESKQIEQAEPFVLENAILNCNLTWENTKKGEKKNGKTDRIKKTKDSTY